MRLFFVVVAAAIAGSACVTTSGGGVLTRELVRFEATPPTVSGWKQVKAPGFTLYTDLEPALAERATLLLSQSLAGLEVMFGKAPIAQELPLTIIAMHDDLDFEKRFGARTWGFAATNGGGTTILLYGPPDRWFVRNENTYEGKESVLQHELAHAVLARYFVRQPKWFAEGLAKYLETYRWLTPQKLLLGEPNLEAYRAYRAIRSLSVTDLTAWNSMDERDLKVAGLYGLSWAFVHYLRNQEPRALGAYMQALATQGPDVAWQSTFAGREEALDKAIYAYMKQGSYKQLTIEVAPPVAALVKLEAADGPAVVTQLDALEAMFKPAPASAK